MQYITLNENNIETEHICCAFSDKKCSDSYNLKKDWLKNEFKNGYVFKRLNERAKVFIEYGPAEKAWVPVIAPNYMMVNCFWVSGKYKGNGHGKELLNHAILDAIEQGKDGLVTIVGNKKFHFMSDTKWLLKQGFEICDSTPSGFSLLVRYINREGKQPIFNDSVKSDECVEKNGCVVYYSNRCPYSEYYVRNSLLEAVTKRNIDLKIVKLENMEQAQTAPTPATIFSLFYNGKFITTDISICMDNRFDKIFKQH